MEGDDDFDLDFGDDLGEDTQGQDPGNDALHDDGAGEGGDGGGRVDPVSVPGAGPGNGEGEQEPVRRSRAAARIEALDREARSARERAEAAERRLTELTTNQSRAQSEAQEHQRLAQMMPDERAEYLARKTAEDTRRELSNLRQEMADSADRSAFAADCAGNPALARVKDEVETTLTNLRQQGQTLPRKALAAYIIGNRVLDKAPKAGAKQRDTAAARVARETARPVTGGSDAPGGRAPKDDRAARLARLDGASI